MLPRRDRSNDQYLTLFNILYPPTSGARGTAQQQVDPARGLPSGLVRVAHLGRPSVLRRARPGRRGRGKGGRRGNREEARLQLLPGPDRGRRGDQLVGTDHTAVPRRRGPGPARRYDSRGGAPEDEPRPDRGGGTGRPAPVDCERRRPVHRAGQPRLRAVHGRRAQDQRGEARRRHPNGAVRRPPPSEGGVGHAHDHRGGRNGETVQLRAALRRADLEFDRGPVRERPDDPDPVRAGPEHGRRVPGRGLPPASAAGSRRGHAQERPQGAAGGVQHAGPRVRRVRRARHGLARGARAHQVPRPPRPLRVEPGHPQDQRGHRRRHVERRPVPHLVGRVQRQPRPGHPAHPHCEPPREPEELLPPLPRGEGCVPRSVAGVGVGHAGSPGRAHSAVEAGLLREEGFGVDRRGEPRRAHEGVLGGHVRDDRRAPREEGGAGGCRRKGRGGRVWSAGPG
ncbi:hypothetical protein THAOC_34482 [Thalassiosira oceanica]|uniref:Uncharacterized protein n=1 Tax=Thalassiosira oceanica TaxID=159749 RepID=K0RJH7_THAOC|nr:hypothetical protein THAOC_34482 [Thalassiosira oceanica]|eukprot:EJK46832.1 hypothetical protein THAOC_34482 [Thalassiosira oceanica]